MGAKKANILCVLVVVVVVGGGGGGGGATHHHLHLHHNHHHHLHPLMRQNVQRRVSIRIPTTCAASVSGSKPPLGAGAWPSGWVVSLAAEEGETIGSYAGRCLAVGETVTLMAPPLNPH